jgi:hypothetical protein
MLQGGTPPPVGWCTALSKVITIAVFVKTVPPAAT